MEKKINKVGVIIGRFQLPYPHAGHLDLIQQVLDQSDRVLIFVGESPANLNDKNAIPAHLLTRAIREIDEKIETYLISDHPSDKFWSRKLDHQIHKSTNLSDSITLYGSRDSFINNYVGVFETVEIEPITGQLSSTELRSKIEPNNSKDFLNGMIYAQNYRFPIVYSTVDILIRNVNSGCILLGRKPGHNKWQLPGGFIDKGEKASEAAIRELSEECPNIKTTNLKFVDTFPIEDYRYKGTKDGVLTTLFVGWFREGDLTAGDDLEELRWFSLEEANEVIVDNHKKLINA